MILEETSCCGVHEINGLNRNPGATLLEVCEDKWEESYSYEYDETPNTFEVNMAQAFIIFTDICNGTNENGENLAKYIKEQKLGVIYSTTRAKKNPNTGNPIKVWVWSPNDKKLLSWYKKQLNDKI